MDKYHIKLFLTFCLNMEKSIIQTRVHLAEMVGACAYVPSEYVLSL